RGGGLGSHHRLPPPPRARSRWGGLLSVLRLGDTQGLQNSSRHAQEIAAVARVRPDGVTSFAALIRLTSTPTVWAHSPMPSWTSNWPTGTVLPLASSSSQVKVPLAPLASTFMNTHEGLPPKA